MRWPMHNILFFYVYRSYFGECASPDSFLAAVYSIATSNIETDNQAGLKGQLISEAILASNRPKKQTKFF